MIQWRMIYQTFGKLLTLVQVKQVSVAHTKDYLITDMVNVSAVVNYIALKCR